MDLAALHSAVIIIIIIVAGGGAVLLAGPEFDRLPHGRPLGPGVSSGVMAIWLGASGTIRACIP